MIQRYIGAAGDLISFNAYQMSEMRKNQAKKTGHKACQREIRAFKSDDFAQSTRKNYTAAERLEIARIHML